MINAFSKVILVLLYSADGNLKVSVRIDQSRKDPFYYNSIWDKPAIESVNELDEEPEFEDWKKISCFLPDHDKCIFKGYFSTTLLEKWKSESYCTNRPKW